MKAKPLQPNTESLLALRDAARLGPGHRGQRDEGDPGSRTAVTDRLESLGIEPPGYLKTPQDWIDRRAKLFEAGDYPDKGVTVTEETLATLVKAFDLPVPILIEHARSPLQIGYLTDVNAEGPELFGTVALSREANDLIDKSGAHALSLGLSQDLTSIQEVSLVKKPRVPSARLFTGEVLTDWRAECEKLQAQLATRDTDQEIDRLLAQGKLVPAQVPFAKALAAQTATVAFDGDSVPVGHILLSLIEAGPAHRLLSEHVPAGPGSAPFGPDEQAFYDRYFAGLSLEEIARHRSA